MTETIMQCCYTNAVQESGGKISSGWQPVAVSADIPSDAYTGCVNLQNANSTIQSQMTDEQGNVLNLYEITGDGTYVYVSRTQYGLVDRLGRPNMFSHAYIFPWKREDMLDDPNTFLTLDKCNFADNEEAAAAEKTALVRTAPLTLEQALAAAGMDGLAYLTLIRCVFSQFSERKAAKPLYIQYDGSEEQMRAVLYCVYSGLPRYIRKSLCIATAGSNTADSKNIIFSRKAREQECYLVPQTGENNLLTPRTERKIARYGFADHAARNYPAVDGKEYFDRLEKLAVELGDPAASSELVLKIAHQLLMDQTPPSELSGEELDSRLSDALRSKTYGSQRMEDYISDMLDAVRERKLMLTEESEANLADRLSAPTTQRLAEAGEQYNIYRFSTLSAEEAAKLLSRMAEVPFTRYCQTLAKSEKGLQILDFYYTKYALANKLVTWNVLNGLLDETAFMSSRPGVIDLIDEKAWSMYNGLLLQKGAAVDAFQALMDLMIRLYGEENCSRFEQNAREIYWDSKSFDSFACEDLTEYKTMSAESDKCDMFAHLYRVIQTYKQNGEDPFLELVNRYFRDFRTQIARDDLEKTVLAVTERELGAFCADPTYLTSWMKVAAATQTEEQFREVLVLKRACRMRDYDSFTVSYLKLAKAADPDTVRILGDTLLQECRKLDSEQQPIPLDAWILIGTSRYENGFELLGELTEPAPQILEVSESFVVLQSRLLTRDPYFTQAEEYAQSKGAAAKTVRKWLGEVKAAEKRKRAEEKKAEGRGFPFMPWGNREEPEKPAAAEDKPQEKKGFLKFGRK